MPNADKTTCGLAVDKRPPGTNALPPEGEMAPTAALSTGAGGLTRSHTHARAQANAQPAESGGEGGGEGSGRGVAKASEQRQ
eukprot:1468618-Prymnesium_polylepis.1